MPFNVPPSRQLCAQYSGIVIDQNAVPASPGDHLPMGPAFEYRQTFTLPSNYARGDANTLIPPLTGLQVFLNVADAGAAELHWELDRLEGTNWLTLDSGSTTGAAETGPVWFTVFFDAPVPLDTSWLAHTFRLVLFAPAGITSIPFSRPNPLGADSANITFGGVYPSPTDYPSLTNYPVAVETASLLFRVLAGVADSGTDFLGNIYRSAVLTTSVSAVTPTTLDSYWLSAPSPSYFAVQSLYTDQRQNGSAVVVDRFTLDPITPGVQFHVYYSNDANGPGTDPATWDDLLWTPVYKSFQATHRQTYAFPEPISAKYFKIEFTNLQARHYNAGPYELPITYAKYPKWVLEYFLSLFGNLNIDLMSSAVNVTYDALDLAYSYYSGDFLQDPAPPALAIPTLTAPQYPTPATNTRVDPTTLGLINLNLKPFTSQPALMSEFSSMLGQYVTSIANGTSTNYAAEQIVPALGDTSQVSNGAREALLVEKAFPLMFFYLPCRHAYRIAQATFDSGIAYYAGVKSLTFHRDIYTVPVDQKQYNESLADGANALINDWIG